MDSAEFDRSSRAMLELTAISQGISINTCSIPAVHMKESTVTERPDQIKYTI